MAKATDGNQQSPKKQPPVAKPRHDWAAIRARFITGDDSIAECAKREGVNRTTIAKKSSDEGWIEAREQHRAKVAAKTTEQMARNRARSEAEIDGKAHDIALSILETAQEMLRQVADPQELKSVIQATSEAYKLARVTAHLTPEPMANPARSDTDGVIRIKRRGPDGDVVEVTVDGSTRHRSGPDGQQADANTVGVPSGPDEPA